MRELAWPTSDNVPWSEQTWSTLPYTGGPEENRKCKEKTMLKLASNTANVN